jgi:thiol-disulfide isomerase/thioredoxin
MRKTIFGALLLAAFCCPAMGAAPQDDLHPFVRGSWQQLVKAHQGKPVVVHFWGLTCGPCLAELPNWTAERKKRPDLDLVLVDSSPFGDDPNEVRTALKKDGLLNAENWLFADSFEERLRYEIDSHWHGEMPSTLMVDPDGKVTAVTGLMNFTQLNSWLDKQAKQKRPNGPT